MPTTLRPASASFPATPSPPGPRPMTTASQSTGLETAPVGHIDRFDDWRPHVNLNLVVAAQRKVGRIPLVNPHLLARGGEEHRERAFRRPDLGGTQRDSPFLEELAQIEAQRRAG